MQATSSYNSLWELFRNTAMVNSHRPAISVNGEEHSYAMLWNKSASIAATLSKYQGRSGPRLNAVFAYRSATAFAGVIGSLLNGCGYVPLNRTFPTDRSRFMLEKSGCHSLVVDSNSEPQLELLLGGVERRLVLLFPEKKDVADLRKRWPLHLVLGSDDLEPPESWSPPEVAADSIAYLLFTSGSTGNPKGVMVSNANVVHYVNWTLRRYNITCDDRLSQTFDMTFDLSAHDMFVAWSCGACVCCPTQKEMIKPDRFINSARLSVWFSVPSTAVFMRKLGLLKPNMYPNLRLSLFCGEALPAETATQWSAAAPNCIVENIYGPTELTIACTAYRWNNLTSPAECEQGTVPIGQPFDGMRALVVDDRLNEVAPGGDGELLMTGPQLSLGYWQDKEKTERAFVTPPGKSETYYRTGDRVRQPLPGRPLVYLGRMDNQVKILGHRVELGEIEAAVRELAGIDAVIAVGWPITSSGADGIEVFVQADELDAAALKEKLKLRLPQYMLPRNIRAVHQFPLNANGKFDRKALQKSLENNP